MASRTSHLERTAAEPRQFGLHSVRLSAIRAVNPRIRLLTLSLPYAIKFLPGQWLDVHVPGVPKAGGFTITSSPSRALIELRQGGTSEHISQGAPYLELAIQESPMNPPAAWLWQSEASIRGAELQVRIGGKFAWPPPGIDVRTIDELVLIAGGVGINPIISILAHLHEQMALPSQEPIPKRLTLLYGSKVDTMGPKGVLFYPRIKAIMATSLHPTWKCRMFLTNPQSAETFHPNEEVGRGVETTRRRLQEEDILESLPPIETRSRMAAYVCGPAAMTDHFVSYLQGLDGVAAERVLCEKWW